MTTVPRDSVNLPAKKPIITTVSLLGRTFSYEGSTVVEPRIALPDTSYFPGLPGLESLRYLAKAAEAAGLHTTSPVESIGQIAASNSMVFLTLLLRDAESGVITSGIGWFDPETSNYARIYSPELSGYYPEWIGCAKDTVHALFVNFKDGIRADTKWITFHNGALHDINWKAARVPGYTILTMDIWNYDIVFATDAAIGIRYRDGDIKSWATDAVASRTPVQTYCATRTSSKKDLSESTPFQQLFPGKAAEVSAQLGDWLLVTVPRGVEAYVDSIIWVANEMRVSEPHWQCSEPCFFTVRIPSQGAYMITELTNTPITFIDFDPYGAKIGIVSAWAKRRELSPILVPVK